MGEQPVGDWLSAYDPDEVTIATAASHSSLQIFHGARKLGFRTLALSDKKRDLRYYESYPRARPDDIVRYDKWSDLRAGAAALRERNVILVPHGSLIESIGAKAFAQIEVPVYGNRHVLEWESDRDKERAWLEAAGVAMPRVVSDPKQITEPVIVKYHGAKGGKGFFIAKNYHEYKRQVQANEPHTIQEFVMGTRYYLHFFHSRLDRDGFVLTRGDAKEAAAGTQSARKRQAAASRGSAQAAEDSVLGTLQMLSIDRRDESNIDELNRLGSIKELQEHGIDASFVVTGNIPMVIRESLLPKVFEMGEGVVRESYRRFGGLWGPFCLETVVTPELEFRVFEISARIVAGTNPFTAGSPYSEFIAPGLSTGVRIAQELRTATDAGRLQEVLT
jgi:5-formaminoimidazole-4-carboxamide-1-(beta)-D-ribofuranosyl 5'-monophosphate synthetase